MIERYISYEGKCQQRCVVPLGSVTTLLRALALSCSRSSLEYWSDAQNYQPSSKND